MSGNVGQKAAGINSFLKPKYWFFLFGILVLFSGCVRLVGKAGYMTQTEEERKTRTVGFDTAELIPQSG